MRRNHVFLKLLFLTGLGLTILTVFCAAQSVGAILSYQKTDHGIVGKTKDASFAVSVYSEHVIRVQVSRKEHPDDFSYALVDNSTRYTDFSVVSAGNNKIILKTASIVVEIEKSPRLRVVFKDPQGTILNEDAPGAGLSTTFAGDKVTVYKNLQEGERFLGLENQNGRGLSGNWSPSHRHLLPYACNAASRSFSYAFFASAKPRLQH